MKIGLDLTVIQTPHRMRGIGATAINFVKHIPEDYKKKHSFVLFLYNDGHNEALEMLDLNGISYDVRFLNKPKRVDFNFPGKLRKLNGIFNSIKVLISVKKGDTRGGDVSDLDFYLQFDQMQALPKRYGLKTAVILYDLIPYVMEADYLWTYKTARHHADSRKSSLRKALLRKQYAAQVKAVCKSADKLLAISDHTKQDFVKHLGIPSSKIKVTHLGISPRSKSQKTSKITFEKYTENSWGYFPEPIDLKEKPFLLFVGGADPRRRLVDLIAAFNNLRARGQELRLVLAGDTMKGPRAIPIQNVQKYITDSAYLDDIVFLGFVNDDQREWLYENALAFVYPSLYEGFGLPVLEAMQYGTPVITYKNTSIDEIANGAALYAKDALTIQKITTDLIEDKGETIMKRYKALGVDRAKEFSWNDSVKTILKEILH
jgi:glycosyltransferase involved in cell wall biosynthesis